MGMGKGPSLSTSRGVPRPLLNSIVIFLLSSPLATTSPPPLSSSEKSIVSTLSEEALKIPLTQFKGDEVLTLKYNSETDSSEFWHEHNDLEPMYERLGKTSDKILVLNKDEDKLTSGSLHATKQTYVVLRQKEDAVYYPLFAYLRYARPSEKCPIERPCANGNCPIATSSTPTAKLCIEWDTWESRSMEDPTIWLGCSSQVLFSCGFNVSVFEKNAEFNAIMTSYPTISLDSLTKTDLPLPEVESFDDVSSSNSTDYDFFDDLHGSPPKMGMKGRALSDKKKDKLTPGQDGKMYDLCIEPSRTMGPNCFNGLGLSLDAEHPLQYSRPSSSSLNINPPKGNKPNYINYQPIGKTKMAPYVRGSTYGIFTPDEPELQWVKGTMYVFGPGSLDVFEAEDSSLFGSNFPNDQATVGTFTPKKAADAGNFIHGALIPLTKGTGYFIRSGLAYPSKFAGAPGTPITRGFTIPLDNKMEDLFYPDSFIKNSLRLNNPLEKPVEGKISPVSHIKKDFPVKTGTLFPRKWVGSPFVRTEKVFGYAKWTALKGEVPPVKIAVVSGANGNPDEFLAVEEALVTPNNPAKNIAYLGKVTYDSDPNKQVEAYAVPSARQGEVDKYFPSELFYIEPATFNSPALGMKDIGALIKIEAGNKGKPIPVDKMVDIFLYNVELNPPKVNPGPVTREEGSVVEGILSIDKAVNPLKFQAKKEPPPKPAKAEVAPTASSPTEPAKEKKTPKKKADPKKTDPDNKPKEERYPTYKLIGSLPEPIKYHIGYETGTWKPDDKKLQPISVKLYILGMDQLDLIQTNKKIFGSLYPTDKGVAGTYVPTSSNDDHEIHGILIPVGEMTAVIFRDGLGYPASFKTKTQEILGFYAPSMRKQTEFFVPDSFITYKELALPYYVPIEGQVLAEEHMQSEMPAMDGQLLPRGDFKMSVFIRGSLTKLQGEFKDADGKFPPAKVLVIPGQGIKPDEFFPIDDTSLDTPLSTKGNSLTNPATIDRPTIYVRSPSSATPDQFFPEAVYDVSPIKFHVLKRKLEPLAGFIASLKGSKIPPRVPVDLMFDKEHGQPVPSRLAGNLETEDGSQIRGNIILNSIDGPFTFFPDVRDVPKEELTAGYQPGSAQRYNKMVPSAVAKEPEPKDLQKGATTGNFVPDTDNSGKPIRVVVHTSNPNILDTVESEEPVFGRELPDNRGIPGTYTPEDRRGKKKEPSHGILIPVDKNRAFFLRDGTGYFGTFTPKDTSDSPPIPGFIVPLKGPTDRFYFESYITIHPTTKKPTLEGKVIPDESVQPPTPPKDSILLLKKSEPSVLIPAETPPQTVPFTPDDPSKKPSKALMVPGSNGNPDEFFPVDDDDDSNPDKNDASEPIKGKIKTPTKEIPATLVPSNLPGASDEFILDDDEDPSKQSDLVPVIITSTESDGSKIKAFAKLPKDHKGPPVDPTPIFITDGIENVPTRLQSSLTLPDDSTVVGLLVADSPSGPFTFFPGSANPVPSSLKLVPKYDDVVTSEPTEDENITPEAPQEIKAPVPVDGHKGYPNYVPIGKSDKKIVLKMGATIGNFVPDEENDGKPLRIAVHVVGPQQLDNVESEPPIFGQELPEDRGTEGVYTPDENGRSSLGNPIRGILIPVDPHRAYFLRNGLGYPGKFTPKPEVPPTPPTWGFIIPSQAGIRTADLFYPESFVTYNLKPKTLVHGDIEPDKKVQNIYKPRPAQLVIRRAEGNPLIFPDVSAVNGTFQDTPKKRTPRKILVVPENQGNPDEFYPYDDEDDEEDPKDSSPIKGTIKADDLEKGATLLNNPTPGGTDTFVPEDEGEPTPITIESLEDPLNPPVEAYATLPPDHKPPLEKPTPITITKGADQVPSRLKAKLILPNEPPVEGLLVAETPTGPYTFFPGMENPEPTKPKPVQLISPEEQANKKPKEGPPKPKPEARADPPVAASEPEKKPATTPTLLRPPGSDDGTDDDFEPENSEEDSPPPAKKCGEDGNELPSFVQYGTTGEMVQYSIGVTAGIFSTEKGKALPVVVHVIGIDILDVLESEDPIFGPDLPLSDSESTFGTYTPDNPKSNSITGALVPVNSKRAYIIRDGTAYIATFQPENGASPKVKGFLAPSMIRNRDAEFFYPKSFMCSMNSEDGKVQPGEIVPDEKVADFFPKAKGKLVVDPLGPSIFIPDDKKAVDGTFQDDGGVKDPVKLLVIPEQGRKPDEFYPVENVLQNGELTPGKVTTPDKEIKVTAVSRPTKERPDLLFPEENVIELVTLMAKDRSIPKQKAAIVWKGPPKGLPKSSVKVVPLTKSLTLPFKAEVTLMKDDGTFVNGLLAQNGEKDSYTFYPNMKDPVPPTATTDDTGRKPGDESKYPTYVQYGTSSDPIEYMTGVTPGTVTPDDLSPSKTFPAVLAVEGIGKLDTVEFADPVFGTELPSDKGSPAIYQPKAKKGKPTPKPIHGILIPINEKTAYLLRDGLAYTAIFVPHKKNVDQIEGFVFQTFDDAKKTVPFIPDTFMVPSNAKGIVGGMLVPDAETAKFFRDIPGKLATNQKKPHTFIPSEVKTVPGEFQDKDKKNPPKKMLVVPGGDGSPDEFYPDEDDILPEDVDEPVKGTVTTPTKTFPIVAIPNNAPGASDTFHPDDDEDDENDDSNQPKVQIAPLFVLAQDEEDPPAAPVKATLVRPKNEKGRPKKPVELIINDPEALKKLAPRKEVILELDDGTKVPGLLVVVPEDGSVTFYPGAQNVSPTEVNEPENDEKVPPTTAGAPIEEKPDVNDEGDEIEPEDSKYPTYIQYGTTAEPIEYKVGGSVGVFTPEESSLTPLPATVFVFGVDKLDIIQFDKPVFPDFLPEDLATVGTYTPADPALIPIRGVVIPIDERTGYIIRDGLAFTSAFHPNCPKAPIKIYGFSLKPLSGNDETERFVAESYIVWRAPLSKQNLLEGTRVPSKEGSVYFPQSKGKLLTRGYGPSIFIPDGIELVPGTFQDDELAHQPAKVHLNPGKDGKPDEVYPDEDEITGDETSKKGSVTTPWKMIPVAIIPSQTPQIPAKIVKTDEDEPELVTFEKTPGPVKAYLILPKGHKGLPRRATDVVLTKPEDDPSLPISQNANLILKDGTNRTGLLVTKAPGGVDAVFFPGMEQPKKPTPKPVEEPKNPPKKPKKIDDATRPKKKGMYPTYNPHSSDDGPLEYFVGTTEGTFIPDDDPSQSFPFNLNVVGADKVDILVSPEPIFGDKLPDNKGTAGTFKPANNPSTKNPQRAIHGVILPVDKKTAFVIRDGLAYPVTLYTPDEIVPETHGFFVPLIKKPIELFYPDSIITFEPLVAKATEAAPNNLIPAEIVPDEEVDKLTFPDSKGKIVLNRKSPNKFISEQHPEKVEEFNDDDGKIKIPFQVAESSDGLPTEYIDIDKNLPPVAGVARGNLVDQKEGAKDPTPRRAAVLSLPKVNEADPVEFEVYPEDKFEVREVQVTSRNKKLKNVVGYAISPIANKGTEGKPMEIIFKEVKPSIDEPKHSVTVTFIDDESVVRGNLFVNHVSGPHSFFPAGGRMTYAAKEPTFELSGSKPKSESPAKETPPPTAGSPKEDETPTKPEDKAKPEDIAKPKDPNAAPKEKLKPKTPTPIFSEEDDDEWPFNEVYEPTDADNKDPDDPAGPDAPPPKKPEKAIQAIIVPLDLTDKMLYAVKGKIPTSNPERGKPMSFIPYRSEEAKMNYFRGTLKMPGNPEELEGRFRAPKRPSTPPVFIADPMGSDPAVFVASNNPRLVIYGFVIVTGDDFLFQPDEPNLLPAESTPGVLKITGKQNKMGILMKPTAIEKPVEFRTSANPKTAKPVAIEGTPVEVDFYPDSDQVKPIKGNLEITGDKKTFAPQGDPIDKALLPLHGLIVSVTDAVPSQFGFLYPAASEGAPLEFRNDDPKTVLAEFRPDNSPDMEIKGVFIPSKTKSENAGQFIPSNGKIKIPYDQVGTLDKKTSQDLPAVGKITEKDGQGYFTEDHRPTFDGSFHPDIEGAEPIDGMFVYHCPKGKLSAEFRPTLGVVIKFPLPSPGQIIPKVDTHHQVHGILKPCPTSTIYFNFEEDPPNAEPAEGQVDFKPRKEGETTENDEDESFNITQIVYIYGFYFTGTGGAYIFIPRAGTTGQIVSNERPPTDPNAIKFEGILSSHPMKTAPTGEEYYATFTPNHNGRENNLPGDFVTGMPIVFYPAGAISVGVIGKLIRIDEDEWIIIITTVPKPGRWRPPPGVTQFTYDDSAQIVPYDANMIWFRIQERDKMAGVKVKGGYYKGIGGVMVIVPEAYKSGAMYIISGENKIHGKVYPINKGKQLKFIPDDEPTAYMKVKEAGNKLVGELDLDESLSVNGKTPDNGIPASMSLNDQDEFIIVPNEKGQWGYFIPGRKPLPSLVIMVFGGSSSGGGPSGRGIETGEQAEECSHLKNTYFLHEEDRYVLQACLRTVSSENQEKQGFHPYSEVDGDDADEDEEARGGIAHVMNTGANLFISSGGVTGEFLVLENGRASIDLDSLSRIPGKLVYMPDPQRLLFKPDDLSVLLEEAKGTGEIGMKGFFQSKLGIKKEGMLYGTLKLNPKGVSGILSVEKPGKFGIVYVTGNEPVVAGTQMKGRTMGGDDLENAVMSSHGILYETGGTGTFLEGDVDVPAAFTFEKGDGKSAEQNMILSPELGLVYSPSSLRPEFKAAMKVRKKLGGKLYIPDKVSSIPATLTKSKKFPMAYHFAPNVPFRTGWMAERKGDEGEEVLFINDDSIDVFQHPGWKTQYLGIEPGVTKSYEKVLFHGLGNCPSDTRTSKADYKKTLDNDDKLIRFFLRVLRTHCLKKHFDKVKKLVDGGILEITKEDDGKVLKMKKDNKLLTAVKLTKRETEDISAAFSMAVLSQTFVEQLAQQNQTFKEKDADGNPVSRSAFFFQKMVMMAVVRSKEVLKPHFVLMMRNMVTTLNTAMVKLDQDRDRIAGCNGCEKDLVTIINDRKHLTALRQFITHNVRFVNDKDPEKRFHKYCNANKIYISKLATKKIRLSNN